MFNPNMVNMGQVPDWPTQSELWKNEKTKYRHWILLFGICMLAILSLYIAGFVWNLLDEAQIKSVISQKLVIQLAANNIIDAVVQSANLTDKWFTQNIIIFPAIIIAMLSIGFMLYFYSVFRSYQAKTFAKLSSYPTFIIGVGALLAFWQLFSLIWRGRYELDFSGGIFLFITYFLIIFVSIGVASPVARIRRSFQISARIELIKKNTQQFESMQQQGSAQSSSSAFGPFAAKANGENGSQQSGAASATAQAPQVKTKEQIEREKLMKLSLQEVRKISQKLSISGYELMDKNELIENIIRLYSDK